MKPMKLFAGAALLAAAFLTTVPAVHAATPEETIAARQANFKRIGEIMDQVKKVVEAGGAPAQVADASKELAERAKRIPGFFPAGTETGGNTKARPEIWSNRAEFDKVAAGIATEADKLVIVAASGTPAALGDQFKATGAACGACHRNFRAR